MIPAWRGDLRGYKLRRQCPTALEEYLTSINLPRPRLMVTYFTLEAGLDLVQEAEEAKGLMEIQFVQFDLLNMDKCIPMMKLAIDDLLQ